ncbi:MAG: PD-(D/E)XK nuclease family protein [Alphaproteobacteria bacterium]|nr:PD-(D/E)XK nuclease family protein [Alphaproteobacteria bacterium]
MTDKKKIEALISDDDFTTLLSDLHRFCPFEALGAVNVELRHSNYLAYLMNPNRPHGYGDQILRSILQSILSNIDDVNGISALDVHLMDLNAVDIRREWRNIDILVVEPKDKTIFCFELKVGSKQGENQLSRYKKIVEDEWRGWTHVFIFLRPTNEEPNTDGWLPVGFDQLIDGLESVPKPIGNEDQSQLMFNSYTKMLRRNFEMDEKLVVIAGSLWKKHEEALKFLSDNQPDELSDLFKLIIDKETDFAQKVSVLGDVNVTLIPDRNSGTKYVRFAIKELEDLEGASSGCKWTDSGRILLLELQRRKRSSAYYIRIVLVLGRGDLRDVRAKWFDAMKPYMTRKNAKISPEYTTMLSENLLSISFEDDSSKEENYEKIEKCLHLFLKESNLTKMVQSLREKIDISD